MLQRTLMLWHATSRWPPCRGPVPCLLQVFLGNDLKVVEGLEAGLDAGIAGGEPCTVCVTAQTLLRDH